MRNSDELVVVMGAYAPTPHHDSRRRPEGRPGGGSIPFFVREKSCMTFPKTGMIPMLPGIPGFCGQFRSRSMATLAPRTTPTSSAIGSHLAAIRKATGGIPVNSEIDS